MADDEINPDIIDIWSRIKGPRPWQPVDAAPKDGSVILIAHNRGTWLYPKDANRIRCRVVFWSGDRFEEFGPDSFSESEIDCWMPFEAPPSPAA